MHGSLQLRDISYCQSISKLAKLLLFCALSSPLSNSPTSISNSKIFSGGDSPGPPLKGGGEVEEGGREEGKGRWKREGGKRGKGGKEEEGREGEGAKGAGIVQL